jgi:hypothetical protein
VLPVRSRRMRRRLGKTKGEFQKMAAFHDIFLSVRAGAARYGSINRQNLGLFLAPNSAGTKFGEFISSPNLDRELGNRAHLGSPAGYPLRLDP